MTRTDRASTSGAWRVPGVHRASCSGTTGGRGMTRRPRGLPAKARITAEEVALFDGINPPSLRRLLLAALASFAEHGFRGTTTRDIARHARMSNAAIYSH